MSTVEVEKNNVTEKKQKKTTPVIDEELMNYVNNLDNNEEYKSLVNRCIEHEKQIDQTYMDFYKYVIDNNPNFVKDKKNVIKVEKLINKKIKSTLDQLEY